MNILQITPNIISQERADNADGVRRVITQLSKYLKEKYNDSIFLGYYIEDDLEKSTTISEFNSSIHLKRQLDEDELLRFIIENKINIIHINLPVSKHYASHVQTICRIAHNIKVKVVFCLHVIPDFESDEYGSFKEVLFNIKRRKPLWSKTKNWLIASTNPISTFVLNQMMRLKYSKYASCDKIVLFSDSYIDKYKHIIRNNDRCKIAIIPNPLSFPVFLSEKDLIEKTKEVILVGRLDEGQKRISYALKIWRLIEANPLLNDWKLSIVGNGRDEDYCLWLAEKYYLKRVSFVGRQDPKPYYKRASILMLTSGYEGWPMVLMEAMPMGCCCISFDSFSAINDIIKDSYNGLIIPNHDLKTYYERMSTLMLNENKRIEMGKHAIESSHQFSMDKIGAKWKKLYQELIAE